MKDNSAGKKRGASRENQRDKSEKSGDAAPTSRSHPRRAKSAAGEPIKQEDIHDVLNSLAAGVFKISKDHRIVYANAQGRRLLNMPDRDPVGMSLREFESFTIWPDGSPCGYDDYPAVKCLRTGERQSGTVLGLRLPGDRLLWITVTAAPMLDPKTGATESTIVTVVDSSQPKHVEDSLRERTEELTKINAELRHKHRFMEQTLAVGERDRKLVAYEIHDTILQEVIGSLMFLDAARENRDTEKKNAHRLDQARKLLRKCIDEARRMISGLRPLIIDEQGIAGAVGYLINEFNGRGLDIRFTHSMHRERLSGDLESAVFRIVQEALTNLERHSQSPKGEVTISDDAGTLHVEIRDFGVGFDPDAVVEGHYGLEGIKQRARLAGGSATIASAKGQGTTITVELPLDGGREPKQAE